MIEEKIKILIDLGFVPMVKGEGNTLFRMNDVVMLSLIHISGDVTRRQMN